ncbi:MAG: hypothetical protein WCP06_07875 [Verrucomicrobiota bacterium]
MKNPSMDTSTTRREFLRGGVRYALLAGLAALAARTIANSNRPSGQSCTNQGICRGCQSFTDCGLPQALSAKQVLNGTHS